MIASFLVSLLFAASTPAHFDDFRHVYERETPCELHLSVQQAAKVSFDISGYLPQEIEALNGAAAYAVDTNLLREGDYIVHARLSGDNAVETIEFPLCIAPPHDRERIPVWRWGGGSCDPEWWERRGFTGAFIGIDSPLKDPGTNIRATLERAARYDFEVGFYFHPLSAKALRELPGARCLLPDGNTDEDTVYPLDPAVLDYSTAVVDSWMAVFGGYPGLRHVMFNSEYQTPFCFNPAALDLAREETGLDLKALVKSKWGPGEPAPDEVKDGVIEDDNARYRLLQWWWRRGHGTAPVNEAANAIVKRYAPDAITWHEPYRLAPVRGSHKGLDCIATWTYGYPDIKRLCYTTYLQAAARPERQLVQQDITLFVYGRYVMPMDDTTADLSRDFAGKDPFFTAGPDYAREALWLVLSQRPDILCFYSAGSLSPDNPANDPFFSSPETFDAIGQTCEEVVQPYGPTLRKAARVAPRVALLMSAAATWFPASPHLPGYPNEQTLPYATLLMMNHVPFDVLLDEDIAEDALDRYATLVLPKADTLTRTVYDRIAAFANAGGKVIADASLRAALPNATITHFDFTHQNRMDGASLAKGNAVTAEEDRAIMEGYAAELAPLLEDTPRPCAADTPRVLTNALDAGAARYCFFVNDRRTYGPRFGQWKLHFELGEPCTCEARIPIEGRPALYDALRGQRIEYRDDAGTAVFPLRMTVARGKIVAALPEPIARLAVDAPAQAKRGQRIAVAVQALGESGAVLDAALPLRVTVTDAQGRDVPLPRYTATESGRKELAFTPALNDPLGTWKVKLTELVANTTGETEIAIAE